MALAEYGNAFNIDTDGSGNPILVDAESGNTIAVYDRGTDAWQVTTIEAATGDFNSVNTGRVNSKVNGGQYQASISGLVVPVGNGVGVADAIDPAQTPTPVQDALTVVKNNGGGGKVLLPPETIDEEGPIDVRAGTSIIGHNFGQGPSAVGGPVSAIHITNPDAGPGIRLDSDRSFRLEGFALTGDGTTGTITPAILSEGVQSHNWGWDHIAVWNWRGPAFKSTTTTYQMNSGLIYVDNVDPGAGSGAAVFDLESMGPGSHIDQIAAYPDGETSGDRIRIIKQSGGLDVGLMNIGGNAGEIWRGDGEFSCRRINWEPADASFDTDPFSIVQLNGGEVNIGMLRVNGFAGGAVTDYVYNITGAGKHNLAEPVVVGGATVNNQYLRINADVTETVKYGGSISDTVSTQTTLTRPVICLGDISKKASNGIGYDGGTDDAQL